MIKLSIIFTPSRHVKCVDCGKLVAIDKESYCWWNEKYGKCKTEERTLVQCADCAEAEELFNYEHSIEEKLIDAIKLAQTVKEHGKWPE